MCRGMQRNGKVYGFAHQEYPNPAGTSFFSYNQDPTTGKLTPTAVREVDWSKWGGLWTPCAGSVTPWDTHLGGNVPVAFLH